MTLLDSLPPSIRGKIWEMVVLWEDHDDSLLRTCRRVREEAGGLVYRRPNVFQSQSELISWAERVPSRFVHQVDNVTLFLQDLDLVTFDEEQSWPSVSLLELYHVAVEKIATVLARFPGIVRFALYKTGSVRSYLYRDFYDLALTKLTRQCPTLSSLSFHSDEHSLDFLKHLQNLRQLRFTGYSKSTPMETLNIFSRLRRLKDIELIKRVRPMVRGGLDVDLSLPNSISMTREILREIRGLEAFAIEDQSTPTFFTSGFLQTLASGQRASLQKLSILLDFVPIPSTQQSLEALLALSSIKHLAVSWPMLDANLIDSLPRSIETLQVPPSSSKPPYSRPPYWILSKLRYKTKELPSFRAVYLMVASGSEQAVATQAFKSAVLALQDVGVTTHLLMPHIS